MDAPIDAGELWGKLMTGPDGHPSAWHPLVDHCVDVAVVYESLLELRSFAREHDACLGQPLTPPQRTRLAVMAFLHDIGKCNWGFQAKSDPNARATAGHVMEGAALFFDDSVFEQWPDVWRELIRELCGWFVGGEDQALQMLLAAISHHGRPVSRNDYDAHPDRNISRWWRVHARQNPLCGVTDMAHSVRAAFPSAFAAGIDPMDANPRLQQRFAGLVMLADWIGSDTAFFPFRNDQSQDRVSFARKQARHALASIGLIPKAYRNPPGFRAVFGFDASPLQSLFDQELPSGESSRLLLAESETGSGKTEAALAWFLRLFSHGRVDSLYFALPTRVAARELYSRVMSAIAAAFPDTESRPGPVLLAAPGYVQVDGAKPLLPDPLGKLWDDDAASRQHERQWAAAHPKRFLAAPIAVGTIDQALLSGLKTKHALLRSVCLDRSLLVVDEVHASDPYMKELLMALLRGHLRRGGWALLLSATLGESSCSAYFDRDMLSLTAAQDRSYPCVVSKDGDLPVPATGRTKTVKVELLESHEDAPLLPLLASAAMSGARVLVICNTVRRANSLLRALEQDAGIPRTTLFSVNGVTCPHHGRFSRDDREVLDQEVSRRLGKWAPDAPLILVGTQTLEQSLDIDADWLVSDLCPMDVLLQRIGRLHRHESSRQRPMGYKDPKLLVRIPEGGDLARHIRSDGSFRAPEGLGTVYSDGRVLQRTLLLLRQSAVMTLPADNRRLVELATHPESLAELGAPWTKHGQHVAGTTMAELRAAVLNTLDDNLPFGELQYRAPEDRVATRLGAGNLDLPLAHPMSLPFGTLVRSIAIPSHMTPATPELPETIEAVASDGGFGFSLAERRYRYTRFGLEIDDA